MSPQNTPPVEEVSKSITRDEFADFRGPDDATFDKFITALDRAYHRPFIMMWRSFLQGVSYALGATVGLTLVITVLVYVLRSLGGIDYFAPGIKKLQDLIIPQDVRSAIDTSNQTTSLTQQLQQNGIVLTSPSPSPTHK